MAINVNDIVGKGFVFEVSAEQIVEPSVNGTISAFVGCSNSGPVGRATLITGGLKEFYNIFGTEPADVTKVNDFGWYAAAHHFRYSQIGYFTRVANQTTGNLVNASVDVARPDTNGSITGSVAVATNLNISSSATISVEFGTSTTPITVSYTVPASEPAFLVGTAAPSSFDFSTTNEVLGVSIVENSVTTSANLTLNSNTTDLNGLRDALNVLVAASSLAGKVVFSVSGGFLKVASVLLGSNITITLTPGAVLGAVFASGNRTDAGANVLRSTIQNGFNSVANTALGTSGVVYMTFDSNNKAVITNTLVVGEDSTLQITSSNAVTTTLFGTPVVANGLYNQILGKLSAIYPGTEGNGISAVFSGSVANGNQVVIYYQNKQLTTISNFNYVPTSSNYIGTLIENDSFVSGVVSWSREDQYPTNIEPITNIFYTCSGGKSGGFNDSEIYPIKADVITAIETYANADVYNIDLLCYPAGGISYGGDEDVQTAMEDVCKSRQDCFTILDPPINIESVTNAIRWEKGDWAPYRSSALDSFYSVTYFPKLRVRFANNKVATVAPSVRAAGQIANSDALSNGLSFYTPAGQRRGVLGGNVIGLGTDLSQKDKDLLYADTYNGRINPISFSMASGYYLDGNKTTQIENNSLRRINTMRTILYVKKRIQTIVPRYFYEPSSPDTWASFRAELASIMKFLEEKNAIEPETDPLNGWSVICDSTNNTSEVTNRNGMVAEISYVGIKSIERIKISAMIREKKTNITVSA